MNKNCQLFYKRLRTLFPSIGFAEGKFLRDIKMQLRDYSIENPNAEYEDVVKFFGNPEDVYVDYIRVQGREEVYKKYQFRETIKRLIYVAILILCIACSITFSFLRKSYLAFEDITPKDIQTTIERGEYHIDENE